MNLLISHSISCHILHEDVLHVLSTDVRRPAGPDAVTVPVSLGSVTMLPPSASAMRHVTLVTAYLMTAAGN